AGDPRGYANLEVGRGQLQAGVLGSEQDVGQDGQRVARADGTTDDLQAAGQVLLHERKLHVPGSPSGASGRRAQLVHRAGCWAISRTLSIFSFRRISNGVDGGD